MKKIKNIYLNFKNYFLSHQPQFLLFFMLILLVNFFSQLPYFNIFIFSLAGWGFFWIIVLMLFRLTGKASIVVSLILLISAPFFLIIKNSDLAEQIGNVAYFLLLIGFMQSFWQYLKEVKTKSEKEE